MSLKRVPQDKAWLVQVVESPGDYVVAEYLTRSLVDAIKFWLMCKEYWKQVKKELR